MAQCYILGFGYESEYYLLFLTTLRNNCTIEEKTIPHYRLLVLKITSIIAVGIFHKSIRRWMNIANSVSDF